MKLCLLGMVLATSTLFAAASSPLDCFHRASQALTVTQAVQLCRGSVDATAADCFDKAADLLTVDGAVSLCTGASAVYSPVDCYQAAGDELTSDEAVSLCRH